MKKLKILLAFNKILIILGIFIGIYVLITTKLIKYHSIYPADTNFLPGKIISFNINGNKLTMDILAQEKIKAIYYLKSLEEKDMLESKIEIGSYIELYGSLYEASNNTIPNTFNYKKYLYNKKIYYLMDVTSYNLKGHNNFLEKIKNYFYQRVSNLPNSDYLKIFILGDKSLISSEDYNNFQKNGVSHLLAISGMHIGVLLKIIDTFLKKIKSNKKFIFVFLILLFYAYLTNFAASIMRSVIFYLFLNLNKLLNLKLTNMQVLIYTAYFLILINPFIIYDVGFIYSFVITGGIILSHKYLKGSYLRQLLLLSFVSFIYSLPITVSLNYEINLTSLLANLVYVPYISIVVYPISLLVFLLPFLSPILSFLLFVLEKINFIFNQISLNIIVPKMPIILIINYYIILLMALKMRKRFLIGLLIIILLTKYITKLDSSYHIYYLDVSQGDSAVVISPHQKEVFMIDTGGKIKYTKESWAQSSKSYNLTDNTIKFLKSKGIRKIDYLFLSHGDYDHAGEALNIINNYSVNKVFINKGNINELEKDILSKAKVTNNINLKYWQISNLNTQIYEEENENSLVLYFNIYNYSFLFMGDASTKVEEDILNNYNLKPINFLKVAHHGSNTSSSSAFVNYIKPKYAIISVGKNNIYNHPHIETLNNLKNSTILRTDLDGTIEINIKKDKYYIKNYAP